MMTRKKRRIKGDDLPENFETLDDHTKAVTRFRLKALGYMLQKRQYRNVVRICAEGDMRDNAESVLRHECSDFARDVVHEGKDQTMTLEEAALAIERRVHGHVDLVVREREKRKRGEQPAHLWTAGYM